MVFNHTEHNRPAAHRLASPRSTPGSGQLLRASGDTDLQPLGRQGAAPLPPGRPHSRVTPRPLGRRVQRRDHIGWTTTRTPAGSGSPGQGGDRGTGQAGSEPRRHARPPTGGTGGGEKFLLNFQTPGPGSRTAAGARAPRQAGEQEGGRRGLELPGRGQSPTPRGHAASLPGPAALARVAAGRRRPAEADARGALSLLHLLLAGRWEAATAAQPARDALLEEEGIPGRPHPEASHSPPLAAGPAPPLPTGAAARRGGGLRLPARARSPELALRRPLGAPSGAGARRGVRGRLGGPGRVVPAGPTWRRGPGGLLRGRGEKAAPARGSLPARAPTTATGEAGLRQAHRKQRGVRGFVWGGGAGVLWKEVVRAFLSIVSPHPLSLIVRSSARPREPPGRC